MFKKLKKFFIPQNNLEYELKEQLDIDLEEDKPVIKKGIFILLFIFLAIVFLFFITMAYLFIKM